MLFFALIINNADNILVIRSSTLNDVVSCAASSPGSSSNHICNIRTVPILLNDNAEIEL